MPFYPSYNQSFTYANNVTTNNAGQFLMRSYTGVVGAVSFFKISTPNSQMGFQTNIAYPNPTDAGIHLYPVEVVEVTGTPYRGRMPRPLCSSRKRRRGSVEQR